MVKLNSALKSPPRWREIIIGNKMTFEVLEVSRIKKGER